jgi:hypothetical protein
VAADIDRDGAADLVLAGNDSAYLVYGKPGSVVGASLASEALVNAKQLDDVAGGFVGGALLSGDVDDDGRVDVIIGAPDGVNGRGDGNGVGEVFVIQSRTKTIEDGLLADAAGIIIHGEVSEGLAFGTSLGLIDTDGDGWNELAVGDPESAGSKARIYLFNQAEAAVDQPTVLFESDAPFVIQADESTGLGGVLASGDITASGYGALVSRMSDSILVMPGEKIVPLGVGKVDPEDAAQTTILGQPGLGRALSTGDFDGDGVTDLVLTALDADTDDGRAYLFRGPMPSGVIDVTDADFSVIGTESAGLGTATAIMPNFASPGALWTIGAASGGVYGFVFPE